MRAGRLRHKVVIEQVAEPQSGTGEPGESWSTFATRRAAIEPLSGDELFASQQTAAQATLVVKMRYLSGVTPKMRVSYTDPDDGVRTLDITSVIDVDEKRRETHLMCTEREVE